MLNSFIIVLREGFESVLLVAVILTYLRRSGQKWLSPVVFAGIVIGLGTSAVLGYFLKFGVSDATLEATLGSNLAHLTSQFLNNEALREGVLGAIAVVMVGTLVVHMLREGSRVHERIQHRLNRVSSNTSRLAAMAGVFLFTFLMITREGMETALLLMQVKDPQLLTGALLGLVAAAIFAVAWFRLGHLINVRRFFQVTGIFLLLFIVQVAIYSFHEFSEAGVLPNSEALHTATEKFSPDGLYGKWFSLVMVSICGLWLVAGWVFDRSQNKTSTPSQLVQAGR